MAVERLFQKMKNYLSIFFLHTCSTSIVISMHGHFRFRCIFSHPFFFFFFWYRIECVNRPSFRIVRAETRMNLELLSNFFSKYQICKPANTASSSFFLFFFSFSLPICRWIIHSHAIRLVFCLEGFQFHGVCVESFERMFIRFCL